MAAFAEHHEFMSEVVGLGLDTGILDVKGTIELSVEDLAVLHSVLTEALSRVKPSTRPAVSDLRARINAAAIATIKQVPGF